MSLMATYRTGANSLASMKGGVFCAAVFFIVMTFMYWSKASVGYGSPHVLMITKSNQNPGNTITIPHNTASFGTASVLQGTATEPPPPRRFKPKDPHVIADVSKSSRIPVASASAASAGYPEEMQHFVKGTNTSLTLNGKKFVIHGFNSYYITTRSPWIQEGRNMVDEVFRDAQALGSNTLRIWGFADGDEWNALQPERGVIDLTVFRDGIDYMVANAHKYGLRLLITLTNYWDGYGGMIQYTKWANKTTITDFYTVPEIKSMYKDFVYTMINRKNSLDGILYRDNPSILGWELANELRHPGFPGSTALQDWIVEMSSYVKSLDTNHLVMVGQEGFFGPSTSDPAKLAAANPHAQIFNPGIDRPYVYNALCEGTDFELNNKPDSIDIAVVHLYPDHWLACDDTCKLEFTRKYIQHHLEACAGLGRPMLVGEFNAMKPYKRRNDFIKVVHEELLNGLKKGYPVAGSLAWMLTGSAYPDYDGFGIYMNATAAKLPRPRVEAPDYSKKSGQDIFFNLLPYLECMDEKLKQSEDNNDDDISSSTTDILSQHSEELKKLVNGQSQVQ